MKTLVIVAIILAVMVLPMPVLAAVGTAGFVDNSGILVWAFLGFCASIVVAQIIPAVLLFTGMLKGVISVVKEETVKVK